MPCYHPLPAWRTHSGSVSLGKQPPDSLQIRLPCGGCRGCRERKAKGWALRCLLELHEHRKATWTTLTYADESLPPTLSRSQLGGFFKRLRRYGKERIRFFASGEYGEQTQRPHYHAIIYGLATADEKRIQKAWPFGRSHTVDITPGAISYTAGYVAKKLDIAPPLGTEYVDYRTGEIFEWQEPFLQMSRRPGIGDKARLFPNSWRSYGILNGQKIPVPRYLHDSWKAIASADDIALLDFERSELINPDNYTEERLLAAEKLAIAKHDVKASRRKL